MRKVLLGLFVILVVSGVAVGQFTFHLIDNFEDQNFTQNPKWWRFGDLKPEIVKNASLEARDLIAESCGEYSLSLSGETEDWYIGGIGTDLGVDADQFARFQIDVYGDGEFSGKLLIELFEDDNQNYSIEQDPQKNYEPIKDDKWGVKVNVQGKGYTRTSIPFSAFRDLNPGVGDDIWNPNQKDGSGGLLKLQLVAISEEQKGKINVNVDNILLTY
ncbi:MAG: hypothetical protein KKA31_04065 [Candidatus Margulisbacteria bacterium]|nr:hypothetical protein [Candidatus Margulisiibacteriota bacterium]